VKARLLVSVLHPLIHAQLAVLMEHKKCSGLQYPTQWLVKVNGLVKFTESPRKLCVLKAGMSAMVLIFCTVAFLTAKLANMTDVICIMLQMIVVDALRLVIAPRTCEVVDVRTLKEATTLLVLVQLAWIEAPVILVLVCKADAIMVMVMAVETDTVKMLTHLVLCAVPMSHEHGYSKQIPQNVKAQQPIMKILWW
jgi:hypothetical protein